MRPHGSCPDSARSSPRLPLRPEPRRATSTSVSEIDLGRLYPDAVRSMIEHLSGRYDLSTEDTCGLCSLAVDLKISETVDAGAFAVSERLPRTIFAS